MSGHACTYTGDNALEIAELGVHVVEHPTQNAIVVFAHEGALDPVGQALPGQVVVVEDTDDGGRTVRVIGVPDQTPLALPVDDLFDPSKATVEEVITYLESLSDSDEDQAEAQRVVQAERAGKNRKTLVGEPAGEQQ